MNTETYRATLDIVELMGKLKRLLLEQRRADCLICRYLADLADGMGQWPGLAMVYGDACQLVRARLGLTLRSTRERIRVGRALRALPALEAALTSGRLTYSRIREVTRVAKPEDEWFWLEAAQSLSMRALERRVSRVSKSVQPGVSGSGTRSGAAHVRLSVPDDVWLLLKQAMHVVTAAAGRKLKDAEALAAVARSALAHHNAFLASQAFGARVSSSDSIHATHAGTGACDSAVERATHTGTGAGNSAVEGATHTGTGAGNSAVEGATHTGTGAGGSADGGATQGGPGESISVRRATTPGEVAPVPPPIDAGRDWCHPGAVGRVLTHDERLIMEAICTGGLWTAAALCEVTGLSLLRLADALEELRQSGLVVREALGLFQEFRLAGGGTRFKQAG